MSETPVETQHVSAACRANKTHSGAWEQAVDLLRQVYDEQVRRRPDATVSLALYVGEDDAAQAAGVTTRP